MVGLLTNYSNRSDLLHELGEAARQLERSSQAEHDRLSVRSVRSPDRKGRVWSSAERLSRDDVYKIAMSYEADELRRDIVAQYNISIRSVGRLLRKWRAEREDVA
jgi:hypothetical protein